MEVGGSSERRVRDGTSPSSIRAVGGETLGLATQGECFWGETPSVAELEAVSWMVQFVATQRSDSIASWCGGETQAVGSRPSPGSPSSAFSAQVTVDQFSVLRALISKPGPWWLAGHS